MMFAQPKTLSETLDRLRKIGVHASQQQSLDAITNNVLPRPWYVQSSLGFAAWISAFLALMFFEKTLGFSNSMMYLYFGLGSYLVAAILCQYGFHNTFFRQLSLALSLAGWFLYMTAVRDITQSGLAFGLFMVAAELTTIVMHPDPVRRFIAITNIPTMMFVIFADPDRFYFIFALMSLCMISAIMYFEHYARFLRAHSEWQRPVKYGLVVSCLLLLSITVSDNGIHGISQLRGSIKWHFLTASFALVYLFLLYRIFRYYHITSLKTVTVAVTLVSMLALFTLDSPGILGALIILTLGYHYGDKIITGLSVAFFGYFFIIYYFTVTNSLIHRSYTLIGFGCVLIIIAQLIRKVNHHAKSKHTDAG